MIKDPNNNHGGLITYVNDNLEANDLCVRNYSSVWENLFVRIKGTCHSGDIKVGHIKVYPPPPPPPPPPTHTHTHTHTHTQTHTQHTHNTHIYRHTHKDNSSIDDMQSFTSELEAVLFSLENTNAKVVLSGDYLEANDLCVRNYSSVWENLFVRIEGTCHSGDIKVANLDTPKEW